MKTLKIVGIVAIIAAIGFGVVAIAGNAQQEAKEDTEMDWFGSMAKNTFIPKMIMSHLKERLNLTDEQEEQILPILKENVQNRFAMFRKFRGQMHQDWQSSETDRQAMWQEMDKQLSEILSEEQMQELRKMRDEHIGKWQDMRQTRMSHAKEFHQLIQELNLSDAQKQKLLAIFMTNQENRKNARDSFLEIRNQFGNLALNILNEDFDEEKVRQTYRESTAKVEEFVVSGAKMFAEMKTVLTPEQLELLQQKGAELIEKLSERGQGRHAMLGKWFHGQGK